jgi:hypothetical protein
MIINIDFDGTATTHDYPRVGKDIGAQKVLKKLTDNGHELILFTMRSGKELTDAVNWFAQNNIPLYGIQTNPTQAAWTSSPKSLADLILDDSALGCPLKYDPTISSRVFVDWDIVEKMLVQIGYL